MAETTPTTTTRHLPPGFVPPRIAHGFDATTWEFRKSPLFRLTYAKRDDDQQIGIVTLRHGSEDKEYDVPDGMTVVGTNEAGGTEATIFHGLHAIDENKFTTSVETSLSVSGVSGKASFSLAKTSRIENDDKKTTTLIAYYKTIYSFNRDEAGELSGDFIKALADLPRVYSRGEIAFESFFGKWGTHYLVSGHFGGNYVMRTIIDDRVLNTMSTEKIKSSVETSFNNGMDSGSAKVDIEKETTHSLDLKDTNTQISWDVVGGDSDKELNNWLTSVNLAPQLLSDAAAVTNSRIRPRFDPIWKLQTDQSAQEALRQAWEAYLPPELQEAVLPPALGVDLNTNIRAETDGFLTAALVARAEHDHGWFRANTDGSNAPSQRAGGAAIHRYGESRIVQSSLFTPVRARDHYRVDYECRNGQPDATASFQPFPLGFGQWQQIPVYPLMPVPQKAQTDGFVVATIEDSGENGNKGTLYGAQGDDPARMTDCVGAAMQWYDWKSSYLPVQSFCMPVPKGNSYTVVFWPGSLTGGAARNPRVTAYWIPTAASHRMLPLTDIMPNKTQQAQTDGILFGHLAASAEQQSFIPDNSSGQMRIEVSRNRDLSNSIILARTAAQFSSPQCFDKPLAYNSLACVVSKGSWYRAAFTSEHYQNGKVQPVVKWVGIERAS